MGDGVAVADGGRRRLFTRQPTRPAPLAPGPRHAHAQHANARRDDAGGSVPREGERSVTPSSRAVVRTTAPRHFGTLGDISCATGERAKVLEFLVVRCVSWDLWRGARKHLQTVALPLGYEARKLDFLAFSCFPP